MSSWRTYLFAWFFPLPPSFPWPTMILAYRYIRDKRRAALAAREAEANAPPTSTFLTSGTPTSDRDAESRTFDNEPLALAPSPAPSSPFSTSLKWKILLMAALVLPVFFETLDYTGRSLSTCGFLFMV